MRNYDAVFFDAANTLLYPYPSVGAVYAGVAARYGVTTTAGAVQAAFRRSWGEAQATAGPVRYGAAEPDGRRFWHALVHATFAQIALPEDFEAFFEELYQLFSQPQVWRLYPECLAVLQTLRERGYIVGVISNWDIRLQELLHGLGLMPCPAARQHLGGHRLGEAARPYLRARPRRRRRAGGARHTRGRQPARRRTGRPAGRHAAAVAVPRRNAAPR